MDRNYEMFSSSSEENQLNTLPKDSLSLEEPNQQATLRNSTSYVSFNNDIDCYSSLNNEELDSIRVSIQTSLQLENQKNTIRDLFSYELCVLLLIIPFSACVYQIQTQQFTLIALLIQFSISYSSSFFQKIFLWRILAILFTYLTIFVEYCTMLHHIDLLEVLDFSRVYFAVNLIVLATITIIKIVSICKPEPFIYFTFMLLFVVYVLGITKWYLSSVFLFRLIDLIYFVFLIVPIKIDRTGRKVFETVYYGSIIINALFCLFGLKVEFTAKILKESRNL